ncbi:motility associated factor glycosyltransferase family protein [Lysinibacillus xylanilyticus]|uniref:motility associated factor glycosyltransferase family protein n=1 Tax=Lysinibacillus xylanilyticus TaxID=582475 RepID=UPI0036DD23F2
MESKYYIEYLNTKNGEKTVKINDYFLHSKYNPSKEASEFADKNFKPERLQLIYGYGAGHFVKAIQKKAKNGEKIIVIEPILSIVDEIKDLIVISASSEAEIREKLDENITLTDNINVIISPNYDKIDDYIYSQVLNAINKKMHSDFVAESTHRFFNKQWPENYLLNLQYILKDQSILKLKEKYSAPVVIASGGPSLTKQLDNLKLYRNNIILIAAGSTVNTLLHNKIQPDYVITVDGSEANFNHFKDIKNIDSKIIYTLYNHHLIRPVFSNEGYYFTANSTMDRHLQKFIEEPVPFLSGGTSVANYAYSLATYITTGPISIIGQDLAFTNNKTHADYNKNSRQLEEIRESEKIFIQIDGYYGEKVLSDYVFMTMKESFEKLYKTLGENRIVFNCTEGGALIRGIKNMPFLEFLNKYAENSITTDRVDNPNASFAQNLKKMLPELEKEKENYVQLKKLFKKSLDLLKSNNSKTTFSNDILRKLDENDEKIQKFSERTVLEISFQTININVLKYFKPTKNESSIDAYTRIYKQNKMLYSEMLEATKETEIHLEKLIELLKKERI